jgi:hypothetical protein
MTKLQLSFAIGNYDRSRALIDGAVPIDGVDPIFMTLVPEEIFFRAFRRKLRNSYAFIANAHLPEKVMLGRGCPRLADSSASFRAAASLLS